MRRPIIIAGALLSLGLATTSWGQTLLDVSVAGEVVTIDLQVYSRTAPNLQLWRRAIDPCDRTWTQVGCFDVGEMGLSVQATDHPGPSRTTYLYDVVWAQDCGASTPPGDFPLGVTGRISASISGAPLAHGRIITDVTLYQTPWLLQCEDSCNPILQSIPNTGPSPFPWNEAIDLYGTIRYEAGPFGFVNGVLSIAPRVCTEAVQPSPWSKVKALYR